MTPKRNIKELTRNEIGKTYYFGVFPSFFEYNKYYIPFKDPILIKSPKEDIEVRIYRKSKETIYIVGWIKDKDQKSSMAMLHLYRRPSYNRFGYEVYEVKTAYVRPDFIGMGVMPKIYSEVVKRGFNIVALDSQSAGARKMWARFYNSGDIKVWGVIGVRFFVQPEEGKTKKDWIESLYITDKFVTKSQNPELSAVILTDDGVEDIKSIYVDTEGYEDLESILILTSDDSKLSQDLDNMRSYEEFPDEENLYKTITKMLLAI